MKHQKLIYSKQRKKAKGYECYSCYKIFIVQRQIAIPRWRHFSDRFAFGLNKRTDESRC